MNYIKTTYFAPAERAAPEQVENDVRLFKENEVFNKIADSVSTMLVILNKQHQIVYANKFFLAFLKTDSNSVNDLIHTDPVILRRILGNMVKNALEASLPKNTITIACQTDDESVQFSVHNTTWIEKNVQMQLFKRSFSTKGTGRGIGTYSMKLFGEKYLKGKVWFESSPEKGTTFFIKIPKN